MVIIPNSRLADSIITNYYGPMMAMAVMVYCGVSYESDVAHVERVALEVGQDVVNDLDEGDGSAPSPGPSVLSAWSLKQSVLRQPSALGDDFIPFVPLSSSGEGEEIVERGLRPLSFPQLPFPTGKGVRGMGLIPAVNQGISLGFR